MPLSDAMPTDPAPATLDPEVVAQAVAAMTTGLHLLREQHNALFDAADGMRADLRARGWSEGAVEGLSYTWTQRMLAAITPTIEPGDSA